MAAFLELDVLRAHAVPDLPRAVREHALAHPFHLPPPHPVSTARRLVAPGGRLTCRWQADVASPLGPPPH